MMRPFLLAPRAEGSAADGFVIRSKAKKIAIASQANKTVARPGVIVN